MIESSSLILSRKQAREIDQEAIEKFGVPSIALMENAGRGIADYLISQKPKGPIVICCGKGNNAGDGFVIARHLDNHQIPVQILLFAKADELTDDAKINYDILVRSDIEIKRFEKDIAEAVIASILGPAEYTIDALFGTGLQGIIRSPFDKIIPLINVYAKYIIAVDIPSGLDCDSGRPLGCAIKAKHTLTLMGMKKGFVCPEAKQYIGKVTVLDIGIPRKLFNIFSQK